MDRLSLLFFQTLSTPEKESFPRNHNKILIALIPNGDKISESKLCLQYFWGHQFKDSPKFILRHDASYLQEITGEIAQYFLQQEYFQLWRIIVRIIWNM